MGKKLIEVALPLEAINRESAREKCGYVRLRLIEVKGRVTRRTDGSGHPGTKC